MRNIRLQGERRNGPLPLHDDDACSFVDRARLASGDGGLFLLANNGRLVRVDKHSGRVLWDVTLNHVLEDEEDDDDVDAGTDQEQSTDGAPRVDTTWFSVTLVDTELICLSRSGAIVTVEIANGEATLVGEFSHGIFHAAWSPSREVLALVTLAEPEQAEGKGTTPSTALLYMTPDFQVLAEVPMELHDVQQAVHLIWRPDGALTGVSSVDQADQQRKIRIYRCDSFELAAVGRTEDGSGKLIPSIQSTPLAWAGPGCSQLMASIVPKGRKDLQVAFLEKNGLRHGQFQLRLTDPTETIVRSIAFNSASDLLMVHLSEPDYDSVQLWSRSNYHWYLKWNRRFYEKCSLVVFDEENPNLLDVLFQNGTWSMYTFRWDTSSVDRFGTAVVVDGKELHLTPLEKALVPPPMAAATIELSCPVQDIVVDRTHSLSDESLMVAVLSDGSLVIIGGSDTKPSVVIGNYVPPVVKAILKLPEEAASWRSFTIVSRPLNNRVEILAAESTAFFGTDKLVHFEACWLDTTNVPVEATIEVKHSVALEGRLLAMAQWSDDPNGALLELADGELLEFHSEDGTVSPLAETGVLLEPCPWIAALKHPGQLTNGDSSKNRLVVGKTDRGRLFCHDLLLADSVSSFILDRAHGFLCCVTLESRCELRFIPLSGLITFDPLGGLDEMLPLLRGYEPRHVERGTCVIATLEKPSVVVQMPRGNLEGIFPRALVLQHCMRLIHANQYGTSFSLMRRQKVDTNLIVDMDPVSFLAEGSVQLIEQIDNIDHLNLFISTLQNWDTTAQKYSVPEWLNQRLRRDGVCSQGFNFSCKVNRVCQRLRSIMIDAEQDGRTNGGRPVGQGHFLLPILSTFAKEDPPQLEQALSLIQSNAISSTGTSSRKPPMFSDTAQQSIHYLAFLAEHELLFNTALGMYDYDIARAVARNSQMDPKFYLPLLQKYRDTPKYFGRYLVDLRLKRYEHALQNLFQSMGSGEDVTNVAEEEPSHGNGFEACFQLIKTHQLHDLGLRLFEEQEEQHRILIDLGDMLMTSNKPDEALDVFLVAIPIDRNRVMCAARACRNWRIYFAHAIPDGGDLDATLDDIEASKRHMLARDIASEIESSFHTGPDKRRVCAEAARVLLDYGRDVHEAVETLLRGQWWDEASRIVVMQARLDLRRRCVEAAVSYANMSIDDCQERSRTFVESSRRYAEVLQIRKEAYASGEVDALGLVEGNQEDETGSMFSAASQASHLSGMSRGSTGSTGSVGSISTVISVKSTTSFTLTGTDEAYRHKSKYNQIGKNSKKKKKKSKGRNRTRPGSEQELQTIVENLQMSLPDKSYIAVLAGTIRFLCRERQLGVARNLYNAVMTMMECIDNCQKERQEKEIARCTAFARDHPGQPVLDHPTEKLVNSWKTEALPSNVKGLIQHVRFL